MAFIDGNDGENFMTEGLIELWDLLDDKPRKEELDMFTIEEVWEEQERQYNQLMEEDDQYCHPESFRWGFEHGFEYALSKLGWHPVSEFPPLDENGNSEDVIVICGTMNFHCDLPRWSSVVNGVWGDKNVKWWCYPPKED